MRRLLIVDCRNVTGFYPQYGNIQVLAIMAIINYYGNYTFK